MRSPVALAALLVAALALIVAYFARTGADESSALAVAPVEQPVAHEAHDPGLATRLDATSGGAREEERAQGSAVGVPAPDASFAQEAYGPAAPREVHAARTWHLRVLDAATSMPIEGAAVVQAKAHRTFTALNRIEPGRDTGVPVPPGADRTDALGHVEVHCGDEPGVSTIVVADGYGLVHIPNRGREETEVSPYVVRLHASAHLRGRVLGLDHDQHGVAWVQVSGGRLHPPGSAHASRGRGREIWRCRLDAQGSFELRDLPPNVELEVQLSSARPRGRPLPPRSRLLFSTESGGAHTTEAFPLARLELAPGEVREEVWDVRQFGAVAGVVVDADDRPQRFQDVRLLFGPKVGMVQSYTTPLQTVRTDSDGRFTFQAVPPGDYVVGVATGGLTSADSSTYAPRVERDVDRHVASLGVPVTVVLGAPTPEVRVVAHFGVFLRGTVQLHDGSPARDVIVFASGPEGATASASTGFEGRFEVGPLVAGEYEVSIHAGSSDDAIAAPDPVTVTAPRNDLELHLRAGGTIAGRIVDDTTGATVRGSASIQEAFGAKRVFHTVIGGAEDFSFGGLGEGPHYVVAVANDGRSGVSDALHLRPGQALDDVVVRVAPIGTLRCRYRGDHERVTLVARRGDVVLDTGSVRPGTTHTFALPAGPITLDVFSANDRRPYPERDLLAREVVEVRAGDVTTLEVE